MNFTSMTDSTLSREEEETCLDYFSNWLELARSLHQVPGAFDRRVAAVSDNDKMSAVAEKAREGGMIKEITNDDAPPGITKKGKGFVIDGWSLKTFLDIMQLESNLRLGRFQWEHNFDIQETEEFGLPQILVRDPTESAALLTEEIRNAGIVPQQDDIATIIADRWATAYTITSFYRPGFTMEQCREELESMNITLDNVVQPGNESKGRVGEFLERKYLAAEQVLKQFFPDSAIPLWKISSFPSAIEQYRSSVSAEERAVSVELLTDQFFEALSEKKIIPPIHLRLLEEFLETPGYTREDIPLQRCELPGTNNIILHNVRLPEILIDVIHKKYIPERADHLEKELLMADFLRLQGIKVPFCFRNPTDSEGIILLYTQGTNVADLVKAEQQGTSQYADKADDLTVILRLLTDMHSLNRETISEMESLSQHDWSSLFRNKFLSQFGGDTAPLLDNYHTIADLLSKEGTYSLIHGNLHIGNFMIDNYADSGDRGITLLDLETVCLGLPQVDLFKLLEDTRLGLSEEDKAELKEFYLTAQEDTTGSVLSEEERIKFHEMYTLVSIGGHLKVVAMYDKYAEKPSVSSSGDTSETFREKATYHLGQAFSAVERSIEAGYPLTEFLEALTHYVCENPRISGYATPDSEA